MPMKNPPHPGGFVLRQCIEPLGLTSEDGWLVQQTQHELAQVRRDRIKLKRLQLV